MGNLNLIDTAPGLQTACGDRPIELSFSAVDFEDSSYQFSYPKMACFFCFDCQVSAREAGVDFVF